MPRAAVRPPASPPRLVVLAAAVALAVALPAALAAQVADALAEGDPSPTLTYPLAAVVMVGAVVGGWVVGPRAGERAPAIGALGGLAAIAVVQAVGVARRLAGGDDVRWATLPATLVLGAALAAAAATLSARRAGRTRP